MRAYAIDEFGKPGSVRDLPTPEPNEGQGNRGAGGMAGGMGQPGMGGMMMGGGGGVDQSDTRGREGGTRHQNVQ